jgi:hypothetical protein
LTKINFGPGMMALQRGDLNGAAAAFLTTLESDPSNIPVHMMLAMVFLRSHAWESALRTYFNVVRIDPMGQRPGNDPQQVDDGVAEALLGWAKSHAATGYATPPPNELVAGLEYYLRTFSLHAADIASVEAALRYRMPIYLDLRPQASTA